MTNKDRQLVDLITEQVIAVLRQRGLLAGQASALPPRDVPAPTTSAMSGSTSPHTAPVHPPIGACTGDYSKFPELQGRLYAQPASVAPAGNAGNAGHAASGAMTGDPAAHPVPLSGIVTANQLQQSMAASADGVVLLTPDARLTPLANDLARQQPECVRRVQPGDTVDAGDGEPRGGALPWLWWIDGQCDAVRQVTRQQQGWLQPLAAGPHSSALSQVVRQLASSLRSRQVAGGVLFVPNAARAMCLANRCAAIRAVVGTCGEAVEQGVRDIGANVLVIEYPHHGPRAMTAMVQRMMQQPPAAPPAVERELADLHRC